MTGERKTYRRKTVGRKPKIDKAVYRYGIKLNEKENGQFKILFQKSGLEQYSKFIKAMVFGKQMKVVKIDKATMDYYIRLTNFYYQFQAIGNNYNQVVKAIYHNFGDKRASILLAKLERSTVELIVISKQIIALTKEYEQKWLQK